MRLMKNNENSLNLSDVNSNIKIDKVDEEIKFDDIFDVIEKYEDMVLVDEEVEKK